MKILVTGARGQLGHDVMMELCRRGHSVVGSGTAPQYGGMTENDPVAEMPYVALDITREDAVRSTVAALCPDGVIHCAAWTGVDAAEEEENIPRVREVNVLGTANLARACRDAGCKLLYVSTDYVFDGQGTEPRKPEDPCCPQNVYGWTKLEGEQAVRNTMETWFIVRTAWVFGKNGENFVKTMLRLGKTHDSLRVVRDQVGTPTYTRDLARLLADMIETERYGVYHATNEGAYVSWSEFAREIFRQAGMGTRVIPVTTEEYGRSKAVRPGNSRLDRSGLVENGFRPLPDWKDALGRYLQEIEV